MTCRGAALAALAVVATLAGCGSDGDSRTVTRTVTQTATAPVEDAPAQEAPGVATDGPTGSRAATAIFRPFAADSPWNTTVTGRPVDAASERMILEAQERVGVIERGDVVATERRSIDEPLFINTTAWTVPIVDEENGVQTRLVCRQIPPDCGDGRRVQTLLVPPDASPKPQYDGWFTILNRREGVAYDLWRARRAGDVISYDFMRRWALNGPGYQKPASVSARGSGLPLFAGVLLPEEVAAGRIEHALAISVPRPPQGSYLQPASATDGHGRPTSLPEGARIRLRADRYDDLANLPTCRGRLLDAEGEYRSDCIAPRTNRKAARAILTALREYGAIVVDRSRTPTLYAKLNADWTEPLRGPDGRFLAPDGRTPLPRRHQTREQATPLLRGNEVQFLRLSDFEVLELGRSHQFPPVDGSAPAQTFTPVVP